MAAKAALNLCTLPSFADIDSDICIKIKNRKYTAPPNSITQSCASRSSLNITSHQPTPCDFQGKSLNKNTEIKRPKSTRGCESDYDFNITTRLPLPDKICIPTQCQIPKEPLEFITRELADPRWNSTYCLQRIITILISPNTEDIAGSRIEEIWRNYLKMTPQGVFLRDMHEISKIIRHVDIGSPKFDFAERFLRLIFEHLKKGIRIKTLSENNCADTLRLTLDGFSRVLTFGSSQIREKILQTLVAWLELYGKDAERKEESYRPKCEDIHERTSCWKDEWKTTDDGRRIYEDPVRCEAYHNHYDTSDLETKCVANCKVTRPKKVMKESGYLSKSAFFGALESSILPSTLEQLCHLQEFDEEYILELIVIRKLCEHSYCIRSCVVNSSILDVCLLKLGYPDPELKILSRTVELLYSLLAFNSCDYNGIRIYVVPGQESFEMLLYRFMNHLVCSSSSTNSLRNDLALIIYLLPLECPQLRTVFSRHVRDFASILANNILTDQPFEILLDSTAEDLELIQYLIWVLDLVIPASPEYFDVIESYQLIPVMMRLIIGPCSLMEEAGIDTAAVTAVINAASQALITFAGIQPLMFLQPEGILPILNTLTIFGNHGQVNLHIVEAFLDVIKILLSRGSTEDEDFEEILEHIAQKKGMESLSGVIRYLTSFENFVVTTERLLCKSLLCCSELGKYNEFQKDEFANTKGVKTIIRLMHQVLYTQSHVRHLNPSLHIMIAECIWNCIADCPTGLEVFLMYEGMFRLLDLLEIGASAPAQYHLLGIVLELIDYSRCRDQMVFWHRPLKTLVAGFSQNDSYAASEGPKTMLGDEMGTVCQDYDQSLGSFLCEIWRDLEKRIGVLREDDGSIKSLEFPLMSEFARNFNRKLLLNRPLPSNNPGPANLDLIMCMRPRIYLILKAVIEETNTQASVLAGLGIPNQVTMKIISNFLELKVSEIWLEMNKEIQAEGLKLVKSDSVALDILLKISRNKVATVISTQRYLIQRGTEQATMNERELYRLLRNSQLQDHLMALREAQYYGTLSDYYLLVDRRLLLLSEISDLYLEKDVASVVESKAAKKSKKSTQAKATGSDEKDKDEFDLGEFGFSIDVNLDESVRESHVHAPLPSGLRSDVSTPLSAEENCYQVSPEVLFKALTKLLAQQNMWKAKNVDEETEWLMRKKWHPDWYPKNLEHV